MALVTKNDVTQIFAIQAPSVDLPPTFANYPRGWDTARSNNGKPTIKQFNYIQQRTDQNLLWIHQNGAALPYDATMEYAEGAVVVKDGELQKKQGASWVFAANKGYNLDYFVSGKSYPLHAEIMLENGEIVRSTVSNNTNNPNTDMTGWGFNSDVINVSNFVKSTDSTALQTLTIQKLLDLIPNGGSINFGNVPFSVDTSLQITDKLKINIVNFNLRASSNWVFTGTRRGILRASDCPDITIAKGYVKGAKKTNPNVAMATALGASGRFQDGAAGIELINCDGFDVNHCEVHHVKTWGIMAIDSSDGVAHDNIVYDCVRQSGISLNLGNITASNNNTAYNNTVYDCGLYAIEIEKQGSSVKNFNAYANKVSGCQAGFMMVNNINAANVFDNTVSGCYHALAAVSCNSVAVSEGPETRSFYQDNILNANYISLAPSNSKYVTFSGNKSNSLRTSDYFIVSPYDAVEKRVSGSGFYCVRNPDVGIDILIKNIECKVLSSIEVTTTEIVEEIGITPVYLVTVDQDISSVNDLTPFKRKVTESYGINMFFQLNKGMRFTGNVIKNSTKGVNQVYADITDNDNLVTKNTFENVGTVYDGGVGYKAINNTHNNCTVIASQGRVDGGKLGVSPFVNVFAKNGISAVGTKPSDTFYSNEPTYICKAHIKATNVQWTTAATQISLVLRLNAVGWGSPISVSTKGANIDVFISGVPVALIDGLNTVNIVDTTGSLGFDEWEVTLYEIN